MQDLNVTLIQSELYWEDIDANLGMFEEKIWQLDEPSDLIVLPEMFSTGFSMNASALAEPMNLKTFKWMKAMAKQTKACVMGSYIVREGEHYFNRLIAMLPDGNYFEYDKRHPFRMAGEHNTYDPGRNRLIFELKGWRICPMICYDLRFPVWARNTSRDHDLDYDVLIYVANWPAPRVNAWDTLLAARAIENLSYCVGVNRVGKDEEGHSYLGHSAVYSYKGERMFFNEGQEMSVRVGLNYDELQEFREKFAFHLDSDHFKMEVD